MEEFRRIVGIGEERLEVQGSRGFGEGARCEPLLPPLLNLPLDSSIFMPGIAGWEYIVFLPAGPIPNAEKSIPLCTSPGDVPDG